MIDKIMGRIRKEDTGSYSVFDSLLGVYRSDKQSKNGIDPLSGLYRQGGLLNVFKDAVAHYDLQTSEMTLNGAKIAQLNDISGNNYHMVQGDDTKRPTLATDVNGKKYLQLRPVFPAKALQATFSLAQPFTIVAVIKQLSFTDGYMLFNFQVGAANGIVQKTLYGADNTLAVAAGVNYQSNPTTVLKLNHLFKIGYSVSGTATNTLFNNHSLKTSNPGTNGIINPAIGRIASAAFGNYDVYEIVIYNKVLTPTELAALNNHLNTKYSLVPLTENYAFGDSIAYGETYNVHSFIVAAGITNTDALVNYSIAGSRLNVTTESYQSVIDRYRAVKSKLIKTRKVFIEVGTNDINAGTFNAQWNTDFRALIAEMITDGFTAGNIYLCTPPYYSTRAVALGTLKGYLDQMAIDYGVKSVDMITPTQAGGGDALLTDTVHPNVTGVGIMSDTLVAAL